MTEGDTEKAAPLSLLMELAQDPRALVSVTRVLQLLLDLRQRGHTGQVILDCADGFVRGCETRHQQRWAL